MVQKWILPTISEVIALSELTLAKCSGENAGQTAATQDFADNINSPAYSTNQNLYKRSKAEREWRGAIAAIEQLLLQSIDLEIPSATEGLLSHNPQGLVFTGPLPVLSHKLLLAHLQNWVFSAETFKSGVRTPFQLPPATAMSAAENNLRQTEFTINSGSVLSLLPEDPLASEQFCFVLTAKFSLVVVLGEDLGGEPAFLFSFEPEVIEQAWRSLQARMMLTHPPILVSRLNALVEKYYPVAPDYRTVAQFSRLLLQHLPEAEEARGERREARSERQELKEDAPRTLHPTIRTTHSAPRPDVELLQAFAHEVRTPLTTIRTLTRLLLKRRDLSKDVLKRLKTIEHECTEQIDRMELLFRAAELQTSTVKHKGTQLTSMSLDQVLQQSIPRWQQSANRRGLTLDVVLPQQLPTVVSDPRMLDQVLTGLIENFTRSLPAGSHIQVQVILAGDQLKLQLLSQSQPGEDNQAAEYFSVTPPICKSLGQLLTFQPETGNISLNLAATKHLFQAIGGKLIVRQRPHQGEVLTIFLPLEVNGTDFSRQTKDVFKQSVS